MKRMMSLMMRKLLCLSKTLEESIERATSEIIARTRASMNQEEDPTSLVLGARNLDISFVRKRRKRTKITKKVPPRKKDQDTRNKPVKLTLVKNGILKKKVNPRMKMLPPWHLRLLLIIPLHYLKISPMMRIKIKSYVLWPRM